MKQFNLETLYISMDSGKSAGKYAWLNRNEEIQADSFTTIVRETAIDSDLTGDADKVVLLIDGEEKAFLVGGTNDDLAVDRSDSKLELKHEVSIYTAIARVITTHLQMDTTKTYDIDLSINVPLADFKQKETRESYQNKYLNNEITLNLNGVMVRFKISQLRLYFEGQGALIRNMHLINREATTSYTFIIDCGSKNDTQILFNKLSPVPGKNSMTPNGINTTLRQLSTKLYDTCKTEFKIQEVEDILLNKTKLNGLTREQVEELFAPLARELALKIKNRTDQFALNTMTTKVLFTGGSSIVLKKYLKEVFEANNYDVTFSTDARFDNCKGALIKALN